ncbi:MAG: ParB N-terminal domain-containing protein [Planctomycetota bacterium]
MKVGDCVDADPWVVDPNPFQMRRQFPSETVADMAGSLAKGQHHPALAWLEGERLVLLDGELRKRSCELLGRKLRVLIVERPQGLDALEQAAACNTARFRLAPLDLAHTLERLITEGGRKAVDVAKALGMSEGEVSRTRALMRLTEPVQRQVAAGRIKPAQGYVISQAATPEEQERLAVLAVRGASRDQLAAALKGAAKGREAAGNGKRKAGARLPRHVARLAGGIAIAVQGPGLEAIADLIAPLELLLKKARKAAGGPHSLATWLRTLDEEAGAGDTV